MNSLSSLRPLLSASSIIPRTALLTKHTSKSIITATTASTNFNCFSQSRRSIVYQAGSRVRGALRNPEDYLTSSSGRKYDLQQADSLVGNLKSFLSKYNITNLPNDVLLQVLTHKSFAHGKKPYNEKLSVFGIHLLKEISSVYFISKYAPNAIAASTSVVEGLNFYVLGSDVSKFILHKNVISEFARANIPGIEKDIFWRTRNSLISDPVTSGENLVLFDTISALIGAINLINGKSVAAKFIEDALLSGEVSLIKLSEEYNELLHQQNKN